MTPEREAQFDKILSWMGGFLSTLKTVEQDRDAALAALEEINKQLEEKDARIAMDAERIDRLEQDKAVLLHRMGRFEGRIQLFREAAAEVVDAGDDTAEPSNTRKGPYVDPKKFSGARAAELLHGLEAELREPAPGHRHHPVQPG